MRIDIVFDTVCPWCFVGKRRFDRALKLRPNLKPEVRYRSFLLNPDLPEALKFDRLNALLELQRTIQERRNRAWIGRDVSVLVEGPNKRNAREWW